MRTSCLLLLASYLLPHPSHAAVLQKWTCETSRVEPVYFNAYHGETLKLDAKLLSNGRPVTNVTTASFLWQTNGMGSAWWQTNATIVAGHVKATFTPAMDPGASAVTFFFQVTDQDGSNYRPAGKLYLVKALGDNPVFPDIPPPGGTIDFSRLTLVNAPWATLEAAQSAVSTGVNEALNAVANESNRAERTYAKLSDIPAVPSIADLATTGQVAAAKAEAQAAAEATAAATYQPLAGMADYAKLTDIPQVPSIAGLATTGEVAAAKAEAQAAAEATAAATYQPLAGMADYAKLTDIPSVPSISGLATTGEVAAAKAEAQAAAESTAAATYQPLVAMVDYAQKHEVPDVSLSNRTISVNGNHVEIPLPGESGRIISDGTNAIDAAGNVYLNGSPVDAVRRYGDRNWGQRSFTPWQIDFSSVAAQTAPAFEGVSPVVEMVQTNGEWTITIEPLAPGWTVEYVPTINEFATNVTVFVGSVSLAMGSNVDVYRRETTDKLALVSEIGSGVDTNAVRDIVADGVKDKRDKGDFAVYAMLTNVAPFGIDHWMVNDHRLSLAYSEDGFAAWSGFGFAITATQSDGTLKFHYGDSGDSSIDFNFLEGDLVVYYEPIDTYITNHVKAVMKRIDTIALVSQLQPPPVTSVNSQTGAVTLSASDVGAATTNDLDSIRAIVSTWEGFLDGSNVVFSITNYLSGTYSLGAAKLRILELRDGEYREVYNSRDEIKLHIDDFRAHDFRDATNSVIAGVTAALEGKAGRAWGRLTSNGDEAPDNMVIINEPQTMFAGGNEWHRIAVGEGAVAVLSVSGAPTYTAGDEGVFKFQDDGGTNYFGFARTDSYTIGCNTDGISVQSNIVTLRYSVTGATPCIWYKAAINNSDPWEQLNTPDGEPVPGASHAVTWDEDDGSGVRECYINCQEPGGFFRATIEVTGGASFITNMPADFEAGILCTDGIHKVKVDWNNGSPRLVEAE